MFSNELLRFRSFCFEIRCSVSLPRTGSGTVYSTFIVSLVPSPSAASSLQPSREEGVLFGAGAFKLLVDA